MKNNPDNTSAPAHKNRSLSNVRKTKSGFRRGHTIIELTIASAISLIVILATGVLLTSGQRAWLRSYESSNKQIKQDSLAASIAFSSMGRKANRLGDSDHRGYILYKFAAGTLEPALPVTSDPEEVVWGDAVEFRYWDVPLDEADSYNVMNTSTIATAYALFYVADGELRVDYGPYPPGAAPEGGGPRNITGVRTQVLAEGASPADVRGAFNHTTLNAIGQGAVRINVELADPDDGDTIKILTAALIRNMWPR